MTDALEVMQSNLFALAASTFIENDDRAKLKFYRYAVGYHLAKARQTPNSRGLSAAIKNLNRFKSEHPEILNPKTKQMRLWGKFTSTRS